MKKTSLYALATLCVWVAACAPGKKIAQQQPVNPAVATSSPSFKKAISKTTQVQWTSGNKVTTYVNGDKFYPPMLDAIRGAKRSITFETYAFVEGLVAYQFVSALCERARAGVKVHMVLDAFGSDNIGAKNISQLKQSGVQLYLYRPYTWFVKLGDNNTRDHRKIMVVDGKIGFIGGCGIADAWNGDAEPPKQWRENHYKVTGPVVAQLQQGFNDNWVQCGGQQLAGDDYYPPLTRTGNHTAQAFISAPVQKQFTVPHFYRQAIASARKRIIIQNSYFLLDQPMLHALLDARRRGVHVEIILPSKKIDAWAVRYLSRYQYANLLAAGVHIYEYQRTMLHCKVMVIDDDFSSIGSANFDPRSLYINDEANLNVISKDFAQKQIRILEADKKNSVRIFKAPSQWNPLAWPKRGALNLIKPYL